MNQIEQRKREEILGISIVLASIQVVILGSAGWLFLLYFPLDEAHVIPFAWLCLVGLWLLSMIAYQISIGIFVRSIFREFDQENAKNRKWREKQEQTEKERDKRHQEELIQLCFETGVASAQAVYWLDELSPHLDRLLDRIRIVPFDDPNVTREISYLKSYEHLKLTELRIEEIQTSSKARVSLHRDLVKVIQDPKLTTPRITKIRAIKDGPQRCDDLTFATSHYSEYDVIQLKHMHFKARDLEQPACSDFISGMARLLESAFLIEIAIPPTADSSGASSSPST